MGLAAERALNWKTLLIKTLLLKWHNFHVHSIVMSHSELEPREGRWCDFTTRVWLWTNPSVLPSICMATYYNMIHLLISLPPLTSRPKSVYSNADFNMSRKVSGARHHQSPYASFIFSSTAMSSWTPVRDWRGFPPCICNLTYAWQSGAPIGQWRACMI